MVITQRATQGFVHAVGWYSYWPFFGWHSLSEEQLLFTKMYISFGVLLVLRQAFDHCLAEKEFLTIATTAQQQRRILERWRATKLKALLSRWVIL